METSTPVRGNQEGTGRDEPEMRDLPASVSWIINHEPHLFSLWWRWSGSDVGSPTGVPSCRPVPTLTGSASTDIYSCFPLPCGKHSASAGRRLPTGAPTPAHLSLHTPSWHGQSLSTLFPQSGLHLCLPSSHRSAAVFPAGLWTPNAKDKLTAFSGPRNPPWPGMM